MGYGPDLPDLRQMKWPMASPIDVELEIARISGLGRRKVLELWAQHLGSTPDHLDTNLMRRQLAYELQVHVFGDLTTKTKRRLRRMYEALKKNPNYKPVPNYRLSPGTVLTREWRGTVHRVGVMDNGYEFNSRRFASLSEIAQRITGMKQSGPLFFGLKDVAQDA
jgi:hypothetical protein